MASSDPSIFSSPATWAAIAAGVGGIAYAVTRPSEPAAKTRVRVVGPGSANDDKGARPGRSKKSKKSKKSTKSAKSAKSASPPSPYALFVKAQMPAFMAKGYSSPEAMKAIGKLWQARK